MPAQRAALPQVVIGCAPEDLAAVRGLSQRLRADGLSPWLQGDEPLPQRDQARALREAVRGAAAVVICLSRRAWAGSVLSTSLANLLDVLALEPRPPQLIALKLTSCDLPPDLRDATVLELFSYSGYSRLVASIGTQISAAAPPAAPAAPAAPATPALALRGRFALPSLERQGLLRRLGRGVARAIWLLDTGRALLVSGGGAALLDLRDGAPIWTIDSPTRCAALSPGSRLLALAGGAQIELWDLRDGRLCTTYSGHSAAVSGLAFAPDERTLASAGHDGSLRLWRVDLDQARQAPLATVAAQADQVACVAFSPDGALLAAGGADRTVRVWRTLDRHLVQTLAGLGGAVEALAFSPDGALLAAGSRGRSARVWATRGWQAPHSLDAHDGAVEALAFSPDSATLATGAADHAARLWRTADGALTRVLKEHSGPIAALAFGPGGASLATLGADDRLLVWSCADGAAQAALRPLSGRVTSLAFSPDGALLATGAADGRTAIYAMPGEGPPQLRHGEHRGPITSLAFAAPLRLLSTAADRTVRECRIDSGATGIMLQTHGATQATTLAPDGRLLASSDGETTVQLWRLTEPGVTPGGQFWRVLRGLRSRARLVAFAPQADLIAVAGDDGSALLWRLGADAREEPALRLSAGARLRSLAFSPDGALLAGGTEGGAIMIWRLSDGADAGALAGDGRAITSLAFAPDGRALAAGDTAGQIQIWRLPLAADKRRRPPAPASTIDAHAGTIEQLAYSPAGGALASGGADGVVRIWRA